MTQLSQSQIVVKPKLEPKKLPDYDTQLKTACATKPFVICNYCCKYNMKISCGSAAE